jgi:hypothetical protein
MLDAELGHGIVDRQRIGPLTAPQQQRKRDRLRIRIGKLLVRGIGEEQLSPIAGQVHEA